MTLDELRERGTCSGCLARTYRGEECVCEDGGDAEDVRDAFLALQAVPVQGAGDAGGPASGRLPAEWLMRQESGMGPSSLFAIGEPMSGASGHGQPTTTERTRPTMTTNDYAGMIGLRVITRHALDRACTTVPAGMAGRIVEATHDYVAVRLDEWVPGLEEWGNAAIITDADDGDAEHPSAWRAFGQDFRPLPEPRYLAEAKA